MFGGFAKAIFGSSNDRYVRSLGKIVDKINALEPTIEAMTDEELKGQTAALQGAGSTTARRSTTSSPKPSPRSARPPSARSASAITTSS